MHDDHHRRTDGPPAADQSPDERLRIGMFSFHQPFQPARPHYQEQVETENQPLAHPDEPPIGQVHGELDDIVAVGEADDQSELGQQRQPVTRIGFRILRRRGRRLLR